MGYIDLSIVLRYINAETIDYGAPDFGEVCGGFLSIHMIEYMNRGFLFDAAKMLLSEAEKRGVFQEGLEGITSITYEEWSEKVLRNIKESVYDGSLAEIGFYNKIAEKAKEICSEDGTDVMESVKKQEFRDEVIRRIFPIRREAEEFYELLQKKYMHVFGIAADIYNYFASKKILSEIDIPEELKKIPFLVLVDEDLEKNQKAISEYRAREFDRIYQ